MIRELLDGGLLLWEVEDLERAATELQASQIATIRVGAIMFSTLPLSELLHRLAPLASAARTIAVADDRILDADMPQVESAFRHAFPSSLFLWTSDNIDSGKHR